MDLLCVFAGSKKSDEAKLRDKIGEKGNIDNSN
jgi:hypothetical protein